MTGAGQNPQDEVLRLRAELKRARREVRQLRRVAESAEQLGIQSKRAMMRSNEALHTTIESQNKMAISLRDAKRLAEEANESKSRFLATMSHEIRTPMNGVIGSLELLRTSELDQDQTKLAELMDGSAKALLNIINDVLDFAKVEEGNVLIESIKFNLSECIESVVAQESYSALKKGVSIGIDLDDELPSVVMGDPYRLRQVLTNLISNAVKFSPNGHVQISALSSQQGERDLVQFTVQDSGIGIEKQALARIFEPFTQADSSTTRVFGGTGLGLSICKGLVELMGGQLSVESELGKGSCFRFNCFLSRGKPVGTGRTGKELTKPAPGNRFAGTLLVVDDNPINRLIAERMVMHLGCEVKTASNGLEALQAVQERPFDMILMDCSMPVMDGYKATSAIRALSGRSSKTTIVAMTAYAMTGDREKCLAAGMEDFLTKPMKLSDLEDLLARHLGVPDSKESA